MTISDVILHIRYTARQAGDPLAPVATSELKTMLNVAEKSSQALMFCLRYEFPAEWSAFANGQAGSNFVATLRKDHFPYLVQNAKQVIIDRLTLYDASDGQQTVDLNVDINSGAANLTLPEGSVLTRGDVSKQVFLVLNYHFNM